MAFLGRVERQTCVKSIKSIGSLRVVNYREVETKGVVDEFEELQGMSDLILDLHNQESMTIAKMEGCGLTWSGRQKI